MQYAIRAVRAAQLGVAATYFFGEQVCAALGRRTPRQIDAMRENKMLVGGGVYALDVVAQTFKSINAFEITYNGHVLHSKLSAGRFPQPGEVAERLRAVIGKGAAEEEAAEEAAA